ncbi:MAG: ABC transporter ATP-binding protein [bacterium]|nr:ABC transporter ATP-binding protein [bacterium]
MVGKNGSGKTTLLNHLVGLVLPTSGTSTTLGRPSGELGHDELARIGAVQQENRFLDWMAVDQHIRYVASFYPRWDRDREAALIADLELKPGAHVGALSPGNAQKLALVLALGHHPELLVLDEPVSALDPIARGKLLSFLLELLREDDATILISSHVLRDIEQVVDRVICLDEGRLRVSAALDDLKELYAEWRLTALDGAELPADFPETFVLHREIDGRQASLLVRRADGELAAFRRRYQVEVEVRPLNLERMFPLLLEEEEPS